jgi:hypothetical protein
MTYIDIRLLSHRQDYYSPFLGLLFCFLCVQKEEDVPATSEENYKEQQRT